MYRESYLFISGTEKQRSSKTPTKDAMHRAIPFLAASQFARESDNRLEPQIFLFSVIHSQLNLSLDLFTNNVGAVVLRM